MQNERYVYELNETAMYRGKSCRIISRCCVGGVWQYGVILPSGQIRNDIWETSIRRVTDRVAA